jgi:VWFA-related protein
MNRKRRFYFASAAAVLFVFLCSTISIAAAQSDRQTKDPDPQIRIDLSPAGYQDLSAMARRSPAANLSLNFLDNDHVLFTFNPKRLFARLPDCPPTHEDRLVDAAVFEVSTGRVVRQTEWYLHDSRRYLWSFGEGRVLLRRLNSFYVVDSDLHEKLLLSSPNEVLWTSVTPDGRQIIVETAEQSSAADTNGKRAPKSRVRIEFLDRETLTVQRVIRAEKPVNLEATSSGFASVTPGISGKVWLVRFGPSQRERANIARVRTKRAPDILYLSSNVLLIGRDSTKSPAYSVSAFTVTGNRLWRQHWDAHRYTAIVEPSADGSRFAISTLKLIAAPVSPSDTGKDTPDSEGLEQHIQVMDTASGDPVVSLTASPVVLSGQNYSLSPDGRRLILLRGTTLEVYELPQMSADEQAKYAAIKADVPGLYVPPAEPAKDAADAGVVFTSADRENEAAISEDTSVRSLKDGSNESADTAKSSAPVPTQTEAATAAPAIRTEDDSQTAGPVPVFKSSAQAVALDVVVANTKGHAVKGVPRQDFSVKEDGRPQVINYFDEVSNHKSDAPRSAEAAKELAPNIFSNDSPRPSANAMALILYDQLNTPIVEQQRAKEELLKFLQNKPKDERFAFCVLSERLQMIQGFTPEESLLVRAITSQKGSLRYNSMLSEDAQSQQTVDWLTQGSMKLIATNTNFATAARTLLDTAGKIEEQDAQRRARDLETRMWLTMDAFTQLARYLAGIPGRKSLIWLSGSFPLGIFPGVDLRNPNSSSQSYTDQVKQAVNLLAESHIALYPVDVRGLSVYSLETPSFSNGTDSTQPAAPSQSPFVPSSDTKRFNELGNLSAPGNIGANLPGGDTPFMEEITQHGIMDQIAGETGGKAFYNTNGIEQAMAIAMEQEANYYALSYTPSNRKYDGKFRKIKVALAASEKNLHVIHRSGYFAVDPDTPGPPKDVKTGFGSAAMQHGSPQSHQILFAVRVIPIGKPRKVEWSAGGAAQPGSSKHRKPGHDPQIAAPLEAQHYAIDYVITPAQLRFDSAADGIRHGVTNFMVASFDTDGTTRTSVVSQAKSELKPESYREVEAGGVRLHQEVDIPVAAAFLRMGVQDGLSGRMGTIEIPLPVKAVPGVEQSLLRSMPEIEPD